MTGGAAHDEASVLVLISGRGSNMRALIEHGRDGAMGCRVTQVLSDRPDAAGLRTARELGVPAEAIPAASWTDRAAYDRALGDAIERRSPALIAMAGFMRVLSGEFVARFAGRMLNIHPSLLPKFPGLHTHRRALAAGEREHGATVHFVTEQLDAGPAVLQSRIDVRAGEDEAGLARRVLDREHLIYPLAVRWYCEGRLRCRDGRAWFDGAPLAAPLRYEDLP